MNTAAAPRDPFPLPPEPAGTRKSLLRSTAKGLLAAALGALVGAGGAFVLKAGLPLPPAALSPWLLALLALVCAWGVLLVHEAGHLIGAKASGLRPMSLMVGPLWLDLRTAPRLRFNRTLSTWGGVAMALPDAAGLSRRQLAATVAGGPLASLGLAAGAASAAAVLPPSAAQLALQLTALISGLIAIVTLLPWQSGGFASDGAQLLQLLRRDPQLQGKSLLSALSALSLNGQRPRQWPRAWVDELQELSLCGTLRASALLLGAMHAEDLGERELAEQRYRALAAFLREGGLPQIPAVFQAAFLLPLVTYLAAQPGRQPEARAWLAVVPPSGLVDDYQRPWAQATLQAFSGQREAALQQAELTLAALRKTHDAGMVPVVRDRLAAWGLTPAA